VVGFLVIPQVGPLLFCFRRDEDLIFSMCVEQGKTR